MRQFGKMIIHVSSSLNMYLCMCVLYLCNEGLVLTFWGCLLLVLPPNKVLQIIWFRRLNACVFGAVGLYCNYFEEYNIIITNTNDCQKHANKTLVVINLIHPLTAVTSLSMLDSPHFFTLALSWFGCDRTHWQWF